MTKRLRNTMNQELQACINTLNEMDDWTYIELETVATINEILALFNSEGNEWYYYLTTIVYHGNAPAFIIKAVNSAHEAIAHTTPD